MRKEETTCCIVGGGPAGLVAGLLLARQGADVLVLEKHGDLLRDFRGDTIHPSTLELGWIDEFLRLPHTKMTHVTVEMAGTPQDAVATANILGPSLRRGDSRSVQELQRVQRRREFPTRVTQAVQVRAFRGLSDEQLLALPSYQTSALFTPVEKLVLDYAVGMRRTPVEVSDALFGRLREHFDDAQLVELTHLIALENLRGRFNLALGVGAAGFSEGMVCAVPATTPSRHRGALPRASSGERSSVLPANVRDLAVYRVAWRVDCSWCVDSGTMLHRLKENGDYATSLVSANDERGAISYVADNALTFAGGSVLTSEYKIDYLRPASGETLVARASVVHAGSRRAVCRCDVFAVGAGGGETFCATAQGTIASVAFRREAR